MTDAPGAAARTVPELLGKGRDDAPAIGAPGRRATSFAELRGLVDDTVESLNALGIGRNDRVAIVLPNGPAMATAFVSIAAGAATAPLNPTYRTDEYDFYLGDLGAKALVVEKGISSPAVEVAQRRGVPVIQLVEDHSAGAGAFRLEPAAAFAGAPGRGGRAEPDDVALVLHTSGTTSRPKIVPLSHLNVCASARHIGATLALGPEDVCLNVMPLFHIHGLIAAVLSSLAAGGSVFCTPGFNALKFFGWLEEGRPTWYTAVPTMHQAILSRAERHRDIISRARLRFIRSSSASLPPQVMTAVEEAFGAPVIESYGMTEASHQMTSNPLPPRARKPGSVGVAAGPQVATMGEDGAILPPGELGEIVIRGPNVTKGYEANPDANAKAFTDGWFRTGDQGVIDHEGYLRITGRLKELINRGGEKVSPLEVDEVLMDHPAVQQVVTFAVPHEKLGEEVAAAVVLRENASLTEHELRDFARARLADFKVPRRLVFLAEIPKGATGKLQRIGLADKLGLGQAAE
jgi:acyl-CoA synthetase (AMP-forming)/AMP-acid ligase II